MKFTTAKNKMKLLEIWLTDEEAIVLIIAGVWLFGFLCGLILMGVLQ